MAVALMMFDVGLLAVVSSAIRLLVLLKGDVCSGLPSRSRCIFLAHSPGKKLELGEKITCDMRWSSVISEGGSPYGGFGA